MSQYGKLNINGFVDYLKEIHYPNKIIISSSNNPNKIDEILIDKNVLLSKFSDNKIKNHWTSDKISLDNFIDFLVNHSNEKTNTKGKYHEYMDYHKVLYNLFDKTNKRQIFPDYSLLTDINIRTKIEPKRVEYYMAYWIMEKIKSDPYIGEFYNIINPSFQKYLSENDQRFYDIVFDSLNIVIEIQEDSSNHLDNSNDILKESLAKFRGKRIYYCKIAGYKDRHELYLLEFWKDLYNGILAGLFSNSNCRRKYVLLRFKQLLNEEYKKYNNELKIYSKVLQYNEKCECIKRQMQKIKDTIKNSNDKAIMEIFKWKDISDKSISTGRTRYTIPIQEIARMILGENKLEDLIIDLKKNYYCYEYDDEMYLDWETMMKIVTVSNAVSNNHKDYLMTYLLYVQRIYEEMFELKEEDTSIRKKNDDTIAIISEKHIEDKIESKHKPRIKDLENKCLSMEIELDEYKKGVQRLLKLTDQLHNCIYSKASNKKEVKLKQEAELIINGLKEKYENFKNEILTVNKTIGESIFYEIPEFPIIYTGIPEHSIKFAEFEAICNSYNISKRIRDSVIDRLFCCKSSKPSVISYILFKNDPKLQDTNDDIDLFDSDNDSIFDDGSYHNSESEDSMDINDDNDEDEKELKINKISVNLIDSNEIEISNKGKEKEKVKSKKSVLADLDGW
jgi:hypothetical protein